MSFTLNALIGLLTLLYPAAVYFGIQRVEPRWVALLLCAVLLLRLFFVANRPARPLLIAGVAYAAFAFWSNQSITLRFYPLVVNAVMLMIFSASLFYPPTVIERLARLQTPDLPSQGVVYTRRVTQVWCVFFLLNGGIALATAVYASIEVWSLYNGLIAYLLMGLLFAGEYLFRRRMLRQG